MKQWMKIIGILLCQAMALNAQFSLYLERKLPVSAEKVTSIGISNNGRFLAFGDSKGKLTVYDIRAGRELHRVDAHWGDITALTFDSEQQRILSGGQDSKVRVWDLYSGNRELEIKAFPGAVAGLSLSPNNRLLTVYGEQSDLFLFEFPIGDLKGRLKGHKKQIAGAAFDLGGSQILSVGTDRQMIVWDVNDLSIVRKVDIESRSMKGSGIDVQSAAFSADRQFVGVGLDEHILAKGGRSMIFKYNLSFFDWKTGSEIELLAGNRKKISFFAVSPDKQYAITDNSTLQNPQLSFWNIRQGTVSMNYPVDGELTALAISEDGQWLAAGFQDAVRRDQSHLNIWKLSGIEGYERFDAGQTVSTGRDSRFGASIRITSPETPLIHLGSRERVAVLEFDGPGLTEDVAKTTTYLLESKLSNSPYVELVERNQIRQVLEELRYQQTGLTTSNAVEVGQHLNARYILLGSINKLGSLLIITSKLVNVETSEIEGTREVQCSNATIETISDMVSVLAPTIVKF